jgi:hypothetical protein
MPEHFSERLLQAGRWAAQAAIVLTSLCTAAVLSCQFALLVTGADWTFLSVRDVLEGASPREHYFTASGAQRIAIDVVPLIEWLLDLPAMLLLAAALGLLAIYYAYVKSVEKTLLGA